MHDVATEKGSTKAVKRSTQKKQKSLIKQPCVTNCNEKCGSQVCNGTVHNKTVDIGCGKQIVCLVPTEKDLINQLNSIGGYNHHYVALSEEEAEENFDNFLKLRPFPGKGKKIGHHRKGHPHYKPYHNDRRYHKRTETPQCVKAGTKVGKDGRKLMCPICQRSTKLSDDVFPRYINEITCDTSSIGNPLDGSALRCLYKTYPIGRCHQKNMTIDVLTKTAEDYELVTSDGTTMIYKQVWSSKTQVIRICCECFDH
ncbi:hypothetical protein QZH41_000727 [Actinostola sp. cb2023]|nr:hypothetical protein QZH41_000727 [Actinostola sp. cb2023]